MYTTRELVRLVQQQIQIVQLVLPITKTSVIPVLLDTCQTLEESISHGTILLYPTVFALHVHNTQATAQAVHIQLVM